MHRLFVAIRPPQVIREGLLDLMEGDRDLRWQSDQQLHLTLRFIGEVERPVAEDIAAALAQIRFP
ncbi:MAG: 2'-5' RNA ligase family protein, partial [Sphingomicrobium sp.]